MNYKSQRERQSLDRKERKQVNETDKNKTFFEILDSRYEQQRVKDVQRFKDMMQAIKKRLETLQSAEQQEWARYLQLKCVQLRNHSKVNELKSHIKRLIHICSSLKIEYNQDLIQAIIKPIFYEKYGDEVLQVFKKAGYSTDQYQFLNYSQSWLSKIWSFFSSD